MKYKRQKRSFNFRSVGMDFTALRLNAKNEIEQEGDETLLLAGILGETARALLEEPFNIDDLRGAAVVFLRRSGDGNTVDSVYSGRNPEEMMHLSAALRMTADKVEDRAKEILNSLENGRGKFE